MDSTQLNIKTAQVKEQIRSIANDLATKAGLEPIAKTPRQSEASLAAGVSALESLELIALALASLSVLQNQPQTPKGSKK